MREFHITLPGGISVNWSPEELGEAMRAMSHAVLAVAAEPESTSRHLGVEILPEDRFRFAGHIYSLSDSPTEWELLETILEFGGDASYADIGDRIWGDDRAPGNRVRQLVLALNRSFQRFGLPLKVRNRRQRAILQLTPTNGTPNAS